MADMIFRFFMNIKYNDTTNAFKLYKKEFIQDIQPFLSPLFNLINELYLKAIIKVIVMKLFLILLQIKNMENQNLKLKRWVADISLFSYIVLSKNIFQGAI